jgi:hypothetical protein
LVLVWVIVWTPPPTPLSFVGIGKLEILGCPLICLI